jgi:hypothetical protein
VQVGLAGVRLVAHAVPGDGRVDVVDAVALPVEHLAGDGANVASGRERVDGSLDPVRVRLRVVVEERDELAGRRSDAEVAASGEPEVLLRLDDDDVVGRGLQAFETVIPRSVLDDDDLEQFLRPVERLETADTFESVIRSAKVYEDDGDDSSAIFLQHNTCLVPATRLWSYRISGDVAQRGAVAAASASSRPVRYPP